MSLTTGDRNQEHGDGAHEEPPRSHLLPTLKQISRIAAAGTIAIGFLVLIGWKLDIAILKTGLVGGTATMKTNTALCFILSGTSLWLLDARSAAAGKKKLNRQLRLASAIAACCAIVIALLTLSQYIFNWNLGIDRLLFSDGYTTTGNPHPGRMGANTALSFLLAGISLVLLSGQRRRSFWAGQILAVGVGLITLQALIGYGYGVRLFYQVSAYTTSMALHTAVALSILSAGLLCSVPDRGLMRTITADLSGGAAARRLLPVAVVLPLVLGWWILWGWRLGLYDPAFAISLLVVAIVMIFATAIWHSAASLNQAQSRRNRAEIALRESYQRFELAAAAVNCLIYDWDIERDIVERTRGIFEVLGYRPEEVAPTREWWRDRVHPDYKQAGTREEFAELIGDAERYKHEYQVRHKDGRYLWVEDRGFVVRNAAGQPIRVVGSSTDITARKQAEAALRESEEKFRLLAENLETVFWISNPWQQQIIYVSPAYERVWDRSCASLYADRSTWMETIHPDDRAWLSAALFEQVEGGNNYEAEFRIVRPDGSIRWIRDRGFPIKDASGKIDRMVGIAEDITASKADREALQNALQRLSFHVENSPLGVIEWDAQFRVSRWSGEAERIFGWAALEVTGKKFTDWQFVLSEDAARFAESASRLVDGSERRQISANRNCTKDGGVIHCEWYNSTLFDESGKLISILSLVLDVSDRVRLEEERDRILKLEQDARVQAEAANRLKDQFLAVLSHELRTPLNPILGWSRLLQTRKFSEVKMAEALATIERNAKLQVDLIDDLLEISKVMQGKLTLNVGPVNLAAVVGNALETVRLAAEAKGITIETAIAPISGQVLGDASRLQQVIWNLLSNAVKFTPPGGRVAVCLSSGCELDNRNELLENVSLNSDTANPKLSWVQIAVSDTGKGIKSDFLPHVFDYFRQADSTTTRKFGGLGLGLAIARQLVELHGGTIEVASPGEGLGTTFIVKLPLTQLELETVPELETGDRILDLSDVNVLVVDDEADSLDFAVFVLEQYRARVKSARSGIEALQIAAESPPDVLVSDIGMPQMDGYMLLREIRSWPAASGGQIPAIALTAYAGEFDRQQARSAGFQMHLSKPFDPIELVAAVAKFAREFKSSPVNFQ
ncbi:MAG: PAS domain-containing protein [Microcoleus sp.]